VIRQASIILLLLLIVVASAQDASRPATKEQLLNKLEIRRAQLELEHSLAQMQRAQAEYEEVINCSMKKL